MNNWIFDLWMGMNNSRIHLWMELQPQQHFNFIISFIGLLCLRRHCLSFWICEWMWMNEQRRKTNNEGAAVGWLPSFFSLSLLSLFNWFGESMKRRAAQREREEEEQTNKPAKPNNPQRKEGRWSALFCCGLWGGAHLRHAISFHQFPKLIPLQPFCLNPLIIKEKTSNALNQQTINE